jgi:glycosyltransferase involved in cell wall biosynthesis/peptidoglycan/xylan/chitin deacetylase (PgdA/CDA1 family)
MLRNQLYFALKPYLPARFRTYLRTRLAEFELRKSRADWPIDEVAGRKPVHWAGWPGGKRFAVVLTHDVESSIGLRNTLELAAVEERLGFRSSFNFVPEGEYRVAPELRQELGSRGFEIGVHDLHHSGLLYSSRASFLRYATKINRYIQEWGVLGFRSALMLHRLDWLHDLEIEYDASTFDTDPFEPQPDGASTIFPFWVPAPDSSTNTVAPLVSQDRSPSHEAKVSARKGYVELPYTLPQDSTLFLFLRHKDASLWKKKVDWIAQRGGMVLLNLHPDYTSLGADSRAQRTYPIGIYEDLLRYIRETYSGDYWHALPRDVNSHVRSNPPSERPRQPRHACMLAYSSFEQDNRVQRYARALASRGDSVDVLSLHLNSSPIPKGEDGSETAAYTKFKSYHFEPGIRVFHVQTRTRDEKRGADYVVRMLSFLARSYRLINKLHRLRCYDVIHVHNVPDFLIFAAWLAKRRGSRLILDLHDLLPEFYAAKFKCPTDSIWFKAMLLCERISCRYADHVIVSNHLWLEKVARRTHLQERCSAMVNHVDTRPYREIAATRSSNNTQSTTTIAAFPGGFYHHQGLHVAIEALSLVRKRIPDAQLHLVGDGPERARLQAQITALSLSQGVQILPPIPISQVPEFLRRASIGVVPKLADGFGNEAYSTKIMEFMAAGLPVLASRTRIDAHYFGNGEVYFFEAGNPEDMARAWIDLIENPELRGRLVEKGSQYVSEHNWERHSTGYLELFDRLSNMNLNELHATHQAR